MRKLLLIGCLVILGCAPGYRIVTLQELETLLDSRSELGATVVLRSGCEIHAIFRGELPDSVLAAMPPDSSGIAARVYIVSPAPESGSFISCSYGLVSTGGGGFSTPGYKTPEGLYIPGNYVPGTMSFSWQHSTSGILPADQIHDLGEFIVCHVEGDSHVFGPEVFVRKLGLERLLREKPGSIHPGYAPLWETSWIVVDKQWVDHFRVQSRSQRKETGPVDDGEDPPGAGDDSDSAFVESAPLTCENIERRVASLPEDQQSHYAPELAACLASTGDDERAVAVLRASIERSGEDEIGIHGVLRWHYLMLLFIHVSNGKLQDAVAAGAAYLHCSPASEEFHRKFDYETRDEFSPAAEFIRARRTDLERHWPKFHDAFDSALEEARLAGDAS